jgi:quinol monooxygenase YgiN
MIVVAGTFHVPPENLAALKPHAETVVAASRTEAGCIVYSFADDLVEPGLIRVFEIWASREQLDAHLTQPHMKPWRAALVGLGGSGRDLRVYNSDDGVPV